MRTKEARAISQPRRANDLSARNPVQGAPWPERRPLPWLLAAPLIGLISLGLWVGLWRFAKLLLSLAS